MKIIPLITAILVAGALGLLILERERVIAFANSSSPVEPVADDAETDVVAEAEADAPERHLRQSRRCLVRTCPRHPQRQPS